MGGRGCGNQGENCLALHSALKGHQLPGLWGQRRPFREYFHVLWVSTNYFTNPSHHLGAAMASSAADVDDAQANAQFAAVLADAAKQYADSSQKNLAEYMTPPMKSVDDLIQQLELQSKHFSEFRAKRRSICDLVAAVVKPVEVVGELVSDAASYVFAPSQNIYCSILFLIKAADDVTSMYDSIVELFEQLRVCFAVASSPLRLVLMDPRTSRRDSMSMFSIKCHLHCGASLSRRSLLCSKF